MTDARILFPQFRDEQSDSRYPFADSATLTSLNGEVQIRSDTFIDATFFPIGATGQLYISNVTITTQKVTITVGDAALPDRIKAEYNPAQPPLSGVLAFYDGYRRPAGMLLADTLNIGIFSTWPAGNYSFEQTATAFVATTCIPANEPGVRGLLTPAGDLLAGDVWLVGDAGVLIRKEAGTENVIRVDVIGVPLFKRFVCEPIDDFPAKPYLKTINGCGPDQFGNFTITATGHGVSARTNGAKNDTILRVYPQNGMLMFDAVGRSDI